MKKPKIKKTDWLTIPEAPNYEINGLLEVRNKTTRKRLKTHAKSGYLTPAVALPISGGSSKLVSLKTLYRKALAAADTRRWFPILMLNGTYELSEDWQVRNAQTTQILKPTISHGNPRYAFQFNGKQRHIMLSTLLNDVFCTAIKLKKRPVGVRIQREGKAYFFYSLRACGKFLANHVAYTPDVIKNKLCKRPKELFGWLIKYF